MTALLECPPGALPFKPFPKIARLFREVIVTEKIDGTNGCVVIDDDGAVTAQSRNRVITARDDNHGFAAWVDANAFELVELLGAGYHYGEWWGNGIQRGYGLSQGDKRFSLFNTTRWTASALLTDSGFGEPIVPGLGVVPTLYSGTFDEAQINATLRNLAAWGSRAAPKYDKPEGIVVYHTAANQLFKVTVENDAQPKLTYGAAR